jgi:hypothetical protein
MAALPTTNGVMQVFRASVTNPGDATYAPDGLAVAPIFGLGGQMLQGNEIVAGGNVTLVSYIGPLLNSGSLCWVLLACDGGAEQVGPATQSKQAVQLAQLTGLVGSALNVRMGVSAASAVATITADQIVVVSALDGSQFKLTSFSKTINLGTTGALGMDVGSAPANGFVAIYAGYNPATGATTAWATNAATLQSAVYGGSNAPAGYTVTGLISVWPTNGSSQFKPAKQRNRRISFPSANAINTSTAQVSPVSLSISSVVPANATTIAGAMQVTVGGNPAGTSVISNVGQDAMLSGIQGCSVYSASGIEGNYEIDLDAAQTIYYTFSPQGSPSSATFVLSISSFEF